MEKSEKEITSSDGTLGGTENEKSLQVSSLYILGNNKKEIPMRTSHV